jgi:phosphocarrier protein
MLTRETIVKNSVGLSARPATDFVLKANTYHCSLWLEYRERRINAKSLLGVLSLKIMKNMTVCIVAEGPDEEIALQELSAMLEKEDA